MKKVFVSFISEFGCNPNYKDHYFGRVEVYGKNSPYAIEEIRFCTPCREKFEKFRDKWDFKDVSLKRLEKIRKKINEDFT